MKKTRLLLLPLLLIGMTACNSKKETSSNAKIVFWHTFGQKPAAALQGKVDNFIKLVKENEGVEVEVELDYQGGYNDMPQKVTTGIATGDMPTIGVAYADHVANYMSAEGNEPGKYVVNLDKYINDAELTFGKDKYLGDTEGISDFVQSYLDEGHQMTRSGTYLMPYMKSTEIMIYNLTACKKLMAYVHPEVPEGKVKEYMQTVTWDDLMALAQAAVDHKAEVSSALEYPVYYDSDSNLFITELYQRNIGYSSIGSDGKGKIDFESGEALNKVTEMVNSLKEAHDNKLLTTKGTEGTYSSDNFKSAKTLFSIGSTGGTGYTIPDAGSFEVAFAKVPTMGTADRVGYISQGPSLCFFHNPSLSEAQNELNLKYAWKLVKYLTSKQVNVSLCVTGSEGYSPVRNSCYTTETYNDFIDEGESYAEAALVTQNDINGRYFNSAVFPGSATLRTQVGAVITSVFTGNSTVEAALTAAINAAKKDIK